MIATIGQKHILIVGSGSVGKRHAENFTRLGCSVSCCDLREDRQQELSSLLKKDVKTYFDIHSALISERFDGVVICSPTSFHIEQAIAAIKTKTPVLMEKPLAVTLEEGRKLEIVAEKTNVPVLMGYTWRWWEPLRQVRKQLSEGVIGSVRHVQFHMSAHLADWHPWEAYQDFFMSKKNLGGGALLDESHWIDLMVWFFGMPDSLIGTVEKISDLDIETDDNVDILAYYPDNKRIFVHLDLYGRPHERFIRFVGEKGTLFWSSDPNEIRVTRGVDNEVVIEPFGCERNDMFKAVAKEFIDLLSGHREMTCGLKDGINVMKVIEAVRESSKRASCIVL